MLGKDPGDTKDRTCEQRRNFGETMETNMRLLLNISKRNLRSLGHIMGENNLVNLTLMGQVEGKRDRGKQRITCLMSLAKWMAEQD